MLNPEGYRGTLAKVDGMVEYCYSLERCPETERLHYQFCIRLDRPVRFTHFKSVLGNTHVEKCKGSWLQNVAYCSGLNADGSRKKSMLSGPYTESKEVVSTDAKEQYKDYVGVFFGDPKIGKTMIWRLIFEYCGGGMYFVPGKQGNSAGRWLGPYQGEENVIIDEFNFSRDFPRDMWKQLLDGCMHMIPTAAGGKSVHFKAKRVVLLANLDNCSSQHPFVSADEEVFAYRIQEVGVWRGIPCPLYTKKRKLLAPLDNFNVNKKLKKMQLSSVSK